MQKLDTLFPQRWEKGWTKLASIGENSFPSMLSPALLGTGPAWWVGQKIHKEWRRDISDTAAAGVTAPWVG